MQHAQHATLHGSADVLQFAGPPFASMDITVLGLLAGYAALLNMVGIPGDTEAVRVSDGTVQTVCMVVQSGNGMHFMPLLHCCMYGMQVLKLQPTGF